VCGVVSLNEDFGFCVCVMCVMCVYMCDECIYVCVCMCVCVGFDFHYFFCDL